LPVTCKLNYAAEGNQQEIRKFKFGDTWLEMQLGQCKTNNNYMFIKLWVGLIADLRINGELIAGYADILSNRISKN